MERACRIASKDGPLKGRQRPLRDRTGRWRLGRACPPCPGTSDVNLFRYRKRVVDFDAEIADGAFNLRVAQQELEGPKIASAAINQRCLLPSQRMRAE